MLFNFICQETTQVDPTVVDIDIVEKRIGPGKINPFEKARRMGAIRKLSGVKSALFIDKNSLASLHIFNFSEIHDVQADAFRGDGIRRENSVMTSSIKQGFDSIRISESDYPLFSDIGHYRVTALDSLKHFFHSLEDMLGF
ncbi:hypothetical protein ES703_123102 [subsurface metagenome]